MKLGLAVFAGVVRVRRGGIAQDVDNFMFRQYVASFSASRSDSQIARAATPDTSGVLDIDLAFRGQMSNVRRPLTGNIAPVSQFRGTMG
ncbi:hypothetical protein [Roseibium aquae]|uniref:hypothetical protein n=1 Tax=Roseibium aquae TaxID=1323746 RepID=UPI0015621203|nr:hypothetical protein [Roseibium aquae]